MPFAFTGTLNKLVVVLEPMKLTPEERERLYKRKLNLRWVLSDRVGRPESKKAARSFCHSHRFPSAVEKARAACRSRTGDIFTQTAVDLYYRAGVALFRSEATQVVHSQCSHICSMPVARICCGRGCISDKRSRVCSDNSE